jgi:N6-L-threonylcarbamoyladenine synthase
MSFRDAAFMGIMRWTVYNRLKEVYPNVHMTFGYITKNTRIENGLAKTHAIDARCISGNPDVKPSDEIFYQKKVRCHNRQIHKMSIGKGGYRKRNQAPYLVKGFRLNDVVKAKGGLWFVYGRRQKGSFVLKKLTDDKLEIVPSKIKIVSPSGHYITERRKALLPTLQKMGYPR